MMKMNNYFYLDLDGEQFERKTYQPLQWHDKNGKMLSGKADDHVEITTIDIYCEIKTNRPGAFHFYFTFEDE